MISRMVFFPENVALFLWSAMTLLVVLVVAFGLFMLLVRFVEDDCRNDIRFDKDGKRDDVY